MTLDLRYKILAGQRRSVDPSTQRVDDIAKGFVAGDGVVGILDPKLDRTGYFQLILGKIGSVDDDMGGCRHFSEVRG